MRVLIRHLCHLHVEAPVLPEPAGVVRRTGVLAEFVKVGVREAVPHLENRDGAGAEGEAELGPNDEAIRGVEGEGNALVRAKK